MVGTRGGMVARRLYTGALLLAFGHALAQSAAPGSPFARVDRTAEGTPRALQMAITSYRSPSRGATEVDLIGAVHIGDRGYYAELNQRFRSYNSLLYELVAPEGAAVPPQDGDDSMVSSTQRFLRTALGLQFQLDEIDYDAPNFVHADLSPAEFREHMAERGESLYVYFWRAFYASVRAATRDPLRVGDWSMLSALLFDSGTGSLKVTIAFEMANVDDLSGMLEGDTGSVLIASRNAKAIEILGRRLDAGDERIGIFYGVAHMPDFDRRLGELNFHPVRTRWIDAWRLDGEPPPLD